MSDRQAHALIVAPTRELAEQIEQECRTLAKGSGLCGSVLIGGVSMGPPLRDIRNVHKCSWNTRPDQRSYFTAHTAYCRLQYRCLERP